MKHQSSVFLGRSGGVSILGKCSPKEHIVGRGVACFAAGEKKQARVMINDGESLLDGAFFTDSLMDGLSLITAKNNIFPDFSRFLSNNAKFIGAYCKFLILKTV